MRLGPPAEAAAQFGGNGQVAPPMRNYGADFTSSRCMQTCADTRSSTYVHEAVYAHTKINSSKSTLISNNVNF